MARRNVWRLALAILLALPGGSVVAQSALPVTTSLECVANDEASAASAAPLAPRSPRPSPAVPSAELTVFGAASLRGAFEYLVPGVQADTGITPVYSFDASSALRAQIEEGAPADVFASADTVNVATLVEAGLAREPLAFACNQLAIIVPAGNPAGISSAADLGRPGVKVIAAGEEVPITRYATQLVERLGIAETYAANIVTREDNVAAVRSRIELGEGDAAIVYRTDAIAADDTVAHVPVPSEANVPATYAAAVVEGTDQPAESRAFLAWLIGTEGQAALARYGFLPPP